MLAMRIANAGGRNPVRECPLPGRGAVPSFEHGGTAQRIGGFHPATVPNVPAYVLEDHRRQVLRKQLPQVRRDLGRFLPALRTRRSVLPDERNRGCLTDH